MAARTQHDWKGDPGGEAEIPPEDLRRLGDATPGNGGSPSEATREALERATAGLGAPPDGEDR